jgi:hypothetical protein
VWYGNIESADSKMAPPLGVGSQLAFVARLLGRRLDCTYEITTRVTLRNRGEPTGFSRLVAPFMATAMRRANRKDLAKLQSALDASS